MLKRLTQKQIGVSMLFAVTLCAIASSLIVDVPFPVEESTAYREHQCSEIVCVWDPDTCEYVCFEVHYVLKHWKIWPWHSDPC